MPSLQIRELPEHIYRVLADKARHGRRSLAQQAVVELDRLVEGAPMSQRLRCKELETHFIRVNKHQPFIR